MMLKTAVLHANPKPKMPIARAENPGERRKVRAACAMSFHTSISLGGWTRRSRAVHQPTARSLAVLIDCAKSSALKVS
jgi:hypothetical protein